MCYRCPSPPTGVTSWNKVALQHDVLPASLRRDAVALPGREPSPSLRSKSAHDFWQVALGELQMQLTKGNFETWLRDTVGLRFEDDEFEVACPSAFHCEWLDKHLASPIQRTLGNLVGRPVRLCFVVRPVGDEAPEGREGELWSSPPATNGTAASEHHASARVSLHPRYTFQSFVVGSNNRLAHAAALSVAERPGRTYNPLFLYGGVGLGKTHLLHAVGHHALGLRRDARVLYVSSEQFTNEFVKAIREHRNDDFREKYRRVDILLIDDIQFIAGKEQTQEEFFHTFNDLHAASHQIVVSSDRAPRSMPLLEDRLRSRFEWGLIADISPPNLETRMAILAAKAEDQKVHLTADVIDFIARRAPSNIREMEGALNRVIAYGQAHQAPVVLETAVEALEEFTARARRLDVTPELIVRVVGQQFEVTEELMRGAKRDRAIVLARHVAMFLMREETSLSLADIGRELGGRDHSTVVHACERIQSELTSNSRLLRQVQEVREALYTGGIRPGDR